MKRLSARYLISYSTEQLWDLLTGPFILVMDDGEVVTNAKECLYSSHGWDFHRKYPKTPLKLRHHVKSIIGNKVLDSKTHLTLLGNIFMDVYNTYVNEPGFSKDLAIKMVYELTNLMYNDLSYRLEAYVSGLSIIDFIKVMRHPSVAPVLASNTMDQASIDRSYAAIDSALLNEPDLLRNGISRAYRAGLANKAQVMQCVGPRGNLTDIDSMMFRHPVMVGYVQGFNKLYDSTVESRSAGKSLSSNSGPLEQAEYFSRRLQILCQPVQNLHPGDCGSQSYLTWHVKDTVKKQTADEEDEDGNPIVSFSGDLKYLAGKIYLDETTNTLKEIKKDDRHLIGKTLKLRSVVAGCRHPDPYGICATCFGTLFFSVPEKTNIGQACSTFMAKQASQSILSTKHLDSSATVDPIILNDNNRRYFRTSLDKNSYLLHDRLAGKSVKMILNPEEVSGLTDIKLVPDILELSITRLSEVREVAFLTSINGVEETSVLTVNLGKRLANLTYPMLSYIRTHGWTLNENGLIVIDMQAWPSEQPIFTMPQKHFNFSDHSNDIADMVESKVTNLKKGEDKILPTATLINLYDHINSKLSVPLAVIEVVMLGAMVVSMEDENFMIPKEFTTKEQGVSSITLPRRSLGGAMAYENHKKIILQPQSFFGHNRPSQPIDVYLLPKETVLDYNTRVRYS